MLLCRVARPFAARAAISGRERQFIPDDAFFVNSGQTCGSVLIERPTAKSIDAINYVSPNTHFEEINAIRYSSGTTLPRSGLLAQVVESLFQGRTSV